MLTRIAWVEIPKNRTNSRFTLIVFDRFLGLKTLGARALCRAARDPVPAKKCSGCCNRDGFTLMVLMVLMVLHDAFHFRYLRFSAFILIFCLIGAACGGGEATSDAEINQDVDVSQAENDGCADVAKPIYAIGAVGRGMREVLRFSPEQATFEKIGDYTCPTRDGYPGFRMAVKSDGTLYVAQVGAETYQVSPVDGMCGERKMYFAPEESDRLLDFAYVADGSTDETLHAHFIRGASQGPRRYLGFIDDTAQFWSMSRRDNSEIFDDLAPRMTGNRLGELWGLFNAADGSVVEAPKIARIDPMTAELTQSMILENLSTERLNGTQAFVYWGGSFYIFYRKGTPSSDVWRVNPADGSVEKIVTASGYDVIAAGVSTCAPTAPPST